MYVERYRDSELDLRISVHTGLCNSLGNAATVSQEDYLVCFHAVHDWLLFTRTFAAYAQAYVCINLRRANVYIYMYIDVYRNSVH